MTPFSFPRHAAGPVEDVGPERKKGQELNSFLSHSLTLARMPLSGESLTMRACERKEKRKVEFLSRINTQAGTVMKFTA